MLDLHVLTLFCLAVLGLLISPGPNMAFVLACGIRNGPKGGLSAAAGISAADLVLTALTAGGVAAAAIAWPPSFNVLRYAGAIYLGWLAVSALRGRKEDRGNPDQQAELGHVFQRSLLTSLLNPKALIFFVVFLPQFVRPQHGNVPFQLVMLGCVLTTIAFGFHAALGMLSASLSNLVSRSGASKSHFAWLQSGIFFALAFRLIVLERPPL